MAEEFEEEVQTSRKDMLLWIAVFGISALLVILFRGKWGQQSFDTATFDAALLIMAVFFAQETWTWFKHRTPKMVYDGNPSHTTFFINDFKKIGRWGIARKGGTMTAGVYWPGNDGTLIAPYDAFTSVGNCVVCNSRCEYTPTEKLPSAVRKFITDNKYPLPVEFGIFTTSQLKSPDYARMEEEIKQQNALIAMYENITKDVMGVKEDIAEWIKRFTQKETIQDSLKKAIFEQEKEK